MSSYSAVASQNIPAHQPKPDPALWNTTQPTASHIADDSQKVNLVAPGFKENPATTYSQNVVRDSDPSPERRGVKKSNRDARKQKIEDEGFHAWNVTKSYLLRPGVAGGLIGIVNLGLLGGAARSFYTQPELRSNTKVIASTIAGAVAILGVEGYIGEAYSNTAAGQEEARRAKEEGSALYRHARENILRPGVLGGIVGLFNTAILGTVGYYSYINWDRPSWDRRTVSIVSVALLTLWGGEGFIAERYRDSRH